MATRKKQNQKQIKSKSKAKNGKVSLPSGYKVIGRAPAWDFEKHPVLEGVRGETQEVTLDKGTKQERDVRLCIVESEELGTVTLWESGMLKDFFDQTEEGQQIRVEFLGYGTAKKKGHNPPKLYNCAVMEE